MFSERKEMIERKRVMFFVWQYTWVFVHANTLPVCLIFLFCVDRKMVNILIGTKWMSATLYDRFSGRRVIVLIVSVIVVVNVSTSLPRRMLPQLQRKCKIHHRTTERVKAATMKKCFHLHFKHVTRDNVWTNHFIDDFQRMISRHHNSLRNFPLVGSMLEASSRLYGLKVDCVHSDVLRLSSGIRRENSA